MAIYQPVRSYLSWSPIGYRVRSESVTDDHPMRQHQPLFPIGCRTGADVQLQTTPVVPQTAQQTESSLDLGIGRILVTGQQMLCVTATSLKKYFFSSCEV